MQYRSITGYQAEGHDVREPSFYDDAVAPFGEARVLHPVAFRSLAFAELEDETIWTYDWICVGGADLTPAIGDLLPYTIGTHGLHVQRTEDGFEARFNKAQHGGCRAIPLQCKTGTKTRCSFTSCGYSRDRDVIKAGAFGQEAPEMHQYLGLRPERLLTAKVERWWGQLFLSLDRDAEPPHGVLRDVSDALDLPAVPPKNCVFREWLEFDANWKLVGQTLTGGIMTDQSVEDGWVATRGVGPGGEAHATAWVFPTLVVTLAGNEACVILLQPTAIGRTICRVSVYSDGSEPRLPWATYIKSRAEIAVSKHNHLTRWYSAAAPETEGQPLPLQDDPTGAWMQRVLVQGICRLGKDDDLKPYPTGVAYAAVSQ